MNRHIAVVTSARSDFGLLDPVISALLTDPAFAVTVWATGMHHSPRHGLTIDEVRASIPAAVLREVPVWQNDDSAAAVGLMMARALDGFARAFQSERPDLLMVLGDRFDMLPAVLAALPAALPVAHISGGEITEGVIDDAIRHAVTKLSHLHFPSQQAYAERLIRMGEEPWRVVVTGEPGLDIISSFPFRSRHVVMAELGLDPAHPFSIVTCHPETLKPEGTGPLIEAVIGAAAQMDSQILLTYPNGDPGSQTIIEAIRRFCDGRPGRVVIPSLGRRRFLDALNQSACLVGNSSSGIVEAASFALPVVDAGSRQTGRLAPRNVIRLPEPDLRSIAAAWRQALDPTFRVGLAEMKNPYGDGNAVPRILKKLRDVPLDRTLLRKRFEDGRG
jgi:UDP-hydrolysing UDP-N-acetyl-D-glucosamine 2-epimerase